MCNQDEHRLCLFSPMCHWTNASKSEKQERPTRVSPSRLGQPERETIGSLSAPHPGELRTGEALSSRGR
jgi:hypothetical protein